MFVKSLSNSGREVSTHELLIIPSKFPNARMWRMERCFVTDNWSQSRAQLVLRTNNPNDFIMNILCGNCRGDSHPDFKSEIKDLVRENNPMLVFITETKQPTCKVDDLRTSLKFDSSTGIDSVSLSGGIWVMWDSTRINVDILPHGQQTLHLLVKVISSNSDINSQ